MDNTFDGLLLFLMGFFAYFGGQTLFFGLGTLTEMIVGVIGLFVAGALFLGFATRFKHTVKKAEPKKDDKKAVA